MTKAVKKLLSVLAVLFLCDAMAMDGEAVAQSSSVLNVATGVEAEDIKLLTNHAIVVESSRTFSEVSVAQPAIVDVSPLTDKSFYLFGKARGSTTLTLLDERKSLITTVTVQVSPNNEGFVRVRRAGTVQEVGVNGASGQQPGATASNGEEAPPS